MKFIKENKTLKGILFILLIVFIGWVFIYFPSLKRYNLDFRYNAEIFSVDNFFDEKTDDFLGEQISKTDFYYESKSKKDNVLIIENVFDVKKISGESIIRIEREYGVDSKTGNHVSGYGDRDREGFLFAPKSLDKSPFYYWHVNYDEPALMRFVQEENLEGLWVYMYEAKYNADQTKDLGHLENVPEERGVVLDINLKLWIEPVTGYLVKYTDETEAYFYDIQSNERLNPWNFFKNRYTDFSIKYHIGLAKDQKFKMMVYQKFIPLILLLLIIISLCCLFNKRLYSFAKGFKKIKGGKLLIRFLYVFTLILIIFLIVHVLKFYNKPPIKIGIAPWLSNSDYNKNIKRFKHVFLKKGYDEGEDIIFDIQIAHGKKDVQRDIINKFVSEKVDLIYVLTTPGTLIAKSVTKDIPIVFSAVTYPIEAGIVESLDDSGNNLVGTRNYVDPAIQFYFFERVFKNTKYLGFFHSDEPNSNIQYKEFKDLLNNRGITVENIKVNKISEIGKMDIESLIHLDGIYMACDTLIQGGGEEEFLKTFENLNIPSFTCNKSGVKAGALMGAIVDLSYIGTLSGMKALKIIEGVDPRWLSTDVPKDPFVIINQKEMLKKGIDVPPDVLEKVDKLIYLK